MRIVRLRGWGRRQLWLEPLEPPLVMQPVKQVFGGTFLLLFMEAQPPCHNPWRTCPSTSRLASSAPLRVFRCHSSARRFSRVCPRAVQGFVAQGAFWRGGPHWRSQQINAGWRGKPCHYQCQQSFVESCRNAKCRQGGRPRVTSTMLVNCTGSTRLRRLRFPRPSGNTLFAGCCVEASRSNNLKQKPQALNHEP